MLLSLSSWLPVLACISQVAATSGRLVIYEHGRTSSESPRTISPETARLIIASRLGVDRYHSLGDISAEDLEAINNYAAPQHVFASGSRQEPVALVLAQGEDLSRVSFDVKGMNRYEIPITPFPSSKKTDELIASLGAQVGIAGSSSYDQARDMRAGMVMANDGEKFAVTRWAESLEATITKLGRQQYTTIVLVESNVTSSSADFGSFVVPKTHNKRQMKEAPLSDTTLSAVADTLDAGFSMLASSNGSSNSTGPLKGILPQCFSSSSICESMTRNCTGHGKCILKYTDKDASSSGAPCYSCSCSSEVRTNADGTKKTTVWGGPACQKKDVVAPFWLLAGFTVFLVSLVSWGIGMLWTMGSQELPSVIGAGVSGPPKRS